VRNKQSSFVDPTDGSIPFFFYLQFPFPTQTQQQQQQQQLSVPTKRTATISTVAKICSVTRRLITSHILFVFFSLTHFSYIQYTNTHTHNSVNVNAY